FKFKPWGAIKLADKLSKGFVVCGSLLGVGLEMWDSYSQVKQEKEFNKAKNEVVDSLNKQRKEYIDFINNTQDFIGQFFPSYFELHNRLVEMEEDLIKRQSFQNEFEAWKREGEIIEADFEIIA